MLSHFFIGIFQAYNLFQIMNAVIKTISKNVMNDLSLEKGKFRDLKLQIWLKRGSERQIGTIQEPLFVITATPAYMVFNPCLMKKQSLLARTLIPL